MSINLEPVAYVWDGSSNMVVLDRFRALARRQYYAGGEYVLVPYKQRSKESHDHYFACIKKGFDNLPEKWTYHKNGKRRFDSPMHLRKWCLVKEGYADQTDVVCTTEEQAAGLVTAVRKMDPYAVMQWDGKIMSIWNAQSQDHASMGHDEFQLSKTRVLERIADMIGISLAQLTKNAKTTT